MDISKIYQEFKKAADKLLALNYEVSNVQMFWLVENEVLATVENVDLANISEDDLVSYDLNSLPFYDKRVKAMIVSNTPSLTKVLKMVSSFYAPLDEMAQVVGPEFFYVDSTNIDFLTNAEIAKKTKASNAVLIATRIPNDVEEPVEGFTLTGGTSLTEAVTTLAILEKSATVNFLASKITFPKAINRLIGKRMHEAYLESYSKAKNEGFTHNEPFEMDPYEMEVRESIIEYAKKLNEYGLVYETWGNISVRMGLNEMLITPSGIPYELLTPYDIVKVNINSLAYQGNLKPSSELMLHAEIYKEHFRVEAIVHTHPLYSSAFAAAQSHHIPVRSESDKRIFGENIKLSQYALAGTKKLGKAVNKALGEKGKACVIAGHGLVTCAEELSEAFDYTVRVELLTKAIFRDAEKADKHKKS